MALRDTRHDSLKSYTMLSGQYSHDQTSELGDYNQALLDDQFEQLGNIYDIEEEKTRGSNIYETIRASIGMIRSVESKNTVVDDERTLFFKNAKYDSWIGKRYRFGNNVWLTTNVSTINTLMNNSLVQRCKNVLKWYDFETDTIYEEPYIEEKFGDNQASQQQHIQVPQGSLSVILQYNEYSKKIKINDRFIINGSAYSVKTVKAINRANTFDKESIGNITIYLEWAEVNPDTDDLENNIAYKQEYVPINPLNGNIVTPDIHELSAFAPYNIGVYEVYNYVNGIKGTDTFEFEFYDALTTKYQVVEVKPNGFTIKCLDFSSIPLVVQYKNLTTNEINEFEIVLRGVL